MTSVLQNSELIIAARLSMGTAAWAINIAEISAVKDGNVVAVLSLETSNLLFCGRTTLVDSSWSQLPSHCGTQFA